MDGIRQLFMNERTFLGQQPVFVATFPRSNPTGWGWGFFLPPLVAHQRWQLLLTRETRALAQVYGLHIDPLNYAPCPPFYFLIFSAKVSSFLMSVRVRKGHVQCLRGS